MKLILNGAKKTTKGVLHAMSQRNLQGGDWKDRRKLQPDTVRLPNSLLNHIRIYPRNPEFESDGRALYVFKRSEFRGFLEVLPFPEFHIYIYIYIYIYRILVE